MDEEQLKIEVGKIVRHLRKKRKMSQEKLAELIGISINSLSNIENGKFFPSFLNLIGIFKAFEIQPNTLFIYVEEVGYKNRTILDVELSESIDTLTENVKKSFIQLIKSLPNKI